ncbi:MAG TPA: imidazolonepropionase [Bacillota bacterium]|nr:imidazolonepropionase [Bacillota bacterium]HOA16040.1 imidazolonepropionase [Bacillota bacterium]
MTEENGKGHVHGPGCGHGHEGDGHVHGPGCGHPLHGEPGHVHDASYPHGGGDKAFDLVVLNIGTLVTPTGSKPKAGAAQSEVRVIRNAWVGIKDGVITEIGGMDDGRGKAEELAQQVVNANGLLVTPGLVDSHTHLAFGGWRHKELALKLKGVPYLEILKGGGGILSTVRATRAASVGSLVQKGLWVLDQMLAHGTTTVEAKSGYGLSVEDEMKQLEALAQMAGEHEVDMVPTFMGAHAVPQEYIEDRDAYVDLVCEKMIPEAAARGLAAYCDVFCEKGAFTPQETERIIEKAKSFGLGGKVHADEINDTGAAGLAARLGAITAEHLIHAAEPGLMSMAEAGTIAVLLPCTSFYLNEDYADARKMIELGIPVAVATDFNPGSTPNLNLQTAMTIALLKYRMLPEEVLTAVTLNAAAAIGLAGSHGSIEVGKSGDLVVWEAPDLDYLLYRYGTNMVTAVVKAGKVHGLHDGHGH